jgi:hypothetical protein
MIGSGSINRIFRKENHMRFNQESFALALILFGVIALLDSLGVVDVPWSSLARQFERSSWRRQYRS